MIKQRLYKNIWHTIPFTLCAILALSADGTVYAGSSVLRILSTEIKGVNPAAAILSALLILFCRKMAKIVRAESTGAIKILSVLFSGFMIIGISFARNGDLSFVLYSKRQFAFAALVFAGWVYLFEFGICVLFRWLSEKADGLIERNRPDASNSYTFRVFILLMAAWLPWIILNWPGSVPHDGYVQINMSLGVTPMTNHHPYLLSCFTGMLVEFGRRISDNAGIFVCVFFFSVIEALCYARVCTEIGKWSRGLGAASALYFALNPMWGGYAQAVVKDGLFAALFSAFFTESVKMYLCEKSGKEYPAFRTLTSLFLLSLGVCLTRNNGFFMCLPSLLLLALLLVQRKAFRKALSVLIAALCLAAAYWGIQNPVMRALHAEQTSVKEALSIPFQQTARFVKYHGDLVTQEEREAIDRILPYKKLSKLYNPDISDPVKNRFRQGASDEQLHTYFKTWLHMARKYPVEHMEATLAGTYAYWYPFSWREALGTYQFYIKGEPIATGAFDFHYVFPEQIRNLGSDYAELWKQLPILSLLITPASYTWIMILCAGFVFYRKKNRRDLLLIIGPALNVAVCIASPVNGLPRYAMPLMACTPMLIAYTFMNTGGEKE